MTKRAQRKAATKAAVLQAARSVFLDRGYDGATIATIAEVANVSPGTVLNASPTKIALLNAIMREDFEALGADCESLVASLSGGVREKIVTLLEQHLARHFENIDLMSAVFGHCWLGETEVLDDLDENMALAWNPILRVLNEAKSDGLLGADIEPETLNAMLQDVYLGVLRRCIAKKLDMFSASDLMRSRLLMVFSQSLAD